MIRRLAQISGTDIPAPAPREASRRLGPVREGDTNPGFGIPPGMSGKVDRAITELFRQVIDLRAEVEALQLLAGTIAKKAGISHAVFLDLLADVRAEAKDEVWIRLEQENPELAAELDDRPTPGEEPPDPPQSD